MSRTTVAGVVAGLEAHGIRITPVNVYSWVRGRHQPRLPVAAALVNMSGGRLSLDDLLEPRALREPKGRA